MANILYLASRELSLSSDKTWSEIPINQRIVMYLDQYVVFTEKAVLNKTVLFTELGQIYLLVVSKGSKRLEIQMADVIVYTVDTRAHSLTNPYTHKHTRSQTHALTNPHAHEPTHTLTNPHTDTNTHINKQTHTHTHTDDDIIHTPYIKSNSLCRGLASAGVITEVNLRQANHSPFKWNGFTRKSNLFPGL